MFYRLSGLTASLTGKGLAALKRRLRRGTARDPRYRSRLIS